MTIPYLYLDINDTGISGSLIPSPSLEQDKTVFYKDLAKPDPDQMEEGWTWFRAALTQLSQDMDISSCTHAVVLVSSTRICFRHTSLPFNQDKKLKQVLPLELSPCFPDPDAPFIMDFFILESRFDDNLYLTFSGAMVQEDMADIFDSLGSMGITPRVVAPRGYAQAMAFLENQEACDSFLYIHIAPSETTITLVVDKEPLMVRALNQGQGIAPQTLAHEGVRLLMGTGQRAGLTRDSMAGIDIFLDAPRAEELSKELDQCFKELSRDNPGPGDIKQLTPQQWPLAITPAIQPPFLFNFCKGPFRADSFLIRHKRHLITCLVLSLMVFCMGLVSLNLRAKALEDQIAAVKQEAMTLYQQTFPGTRTAPIHAPLLLMQSKVKQAKKEKSQGAGDTSAQTVQIMGLLHDLSSRIPGNIDMQITRLVLNHGRLILTGTTDNFNGVDKIKGLMEVSPLFKTVSINSAKADKTGKQVQFKFIVEL